MVKEELHDGVKHDEARDGCYVAVLGHVNHHYLLAHTYLWGRNADAT